MKNIKFFWIILLIFSTAFYSCKKDKDETTPTGTTPTTVAQDKANINLSLGALETCIKNFRDGKLMQSFFSFADLTDGNMDVLTENWLNEAQDSLYRVLDLNLVDSLNRFDMNIFQGDYSFNNTTKQWTKTTLSGKVVLHFPSESTSAINNIAVTLSKYSDQQVEFTVGTPIYIPNDINASITKDGEEILNLDATGIYNSSGYPIPIDINLQLFVKPFTLTITGKRTNATTFTASMNFFDGSGCTTSASATAVIADADYANFDFNNDWYSMVFNAGHGNLSVNGTIDVKTLNQYSNPTADQINGTMNVKMNYTGSQIGTLSFKDINSTNELFIFYKDGSSENTDIYYNPFLDKVDAMFASYFGANWLH